VPRPHPAVVRDTSLDDELRELRRLRYHPSRIPALDALEIFVPDGAESDPELEVVRGRTGPSRWYPVHGGHQVLVLYEGGAFNEHRFALRKGAWDHEHCKRCSELIPSMTLCWVSADTTYTILCGTCHELVSQTFVQRLLRKVGLPLTFPRR